MPLISVPSVLSTFVPSPSLNSTSTASAGTLSFLSTLVTWLLTYSTCFSTTSSDLSSKVILILPSKSPSLDVLLFSSVTSSNFAPLRSSFILPLFSSVAESLALTPSFHSTVSPTHFLSSTGSRPPRASILSAFVSSIFKVPGSDVSGVVSSSAIPPLSVTVAVTVVSPFTLSLGRVITPFTTFPSPTIDQVPSSAFVAVVVFVLPSFPV